MEVKKFLKYYAKKILPFVIYDLINGVHRWIAARKLKVLYNVFNTNYEKKCLYVYILDPFLYGVKDTHQNQWQAVEIARIISSYGYDVDVVDFDYDGGFLSRRYDLVFDIHPQDNRFYDNAMNPNCKRIAYITGSDPEFSKEAEKARIIRVKKTRGVQLPFERICEPISKDLESFSAFMFIGNEYNLKTFSNYSLPKVFFVPNTGYQLDVDKSRRDPRKFLFFASSGQVHKGLDLLLDVFSTICRDCELYICSCFRDEIDFCSVYKHELYDYDNIHALGFMPLGSSELNEIFEKCTYLIVPSCSEGMMGSALTCMSAGIIPILTRECGYDEGEFIPINSLELKDIGSLVHDYAKKDDGWITEKSREVQQIVRSKYMKENFTSEVRRIFSEVL